MHEFVNVRKVEGMARYVRQLLAPAKGFGQGLGFFWAKKAYYAVLTNFRPFVVSSSNHVNF